MQYVKFTGGNGYCGCDFETCEAFEQDMTEEELLGYLDELVRENAESFSHCATGCGGDFESEEEEEMYYENASGDYEIITKEEYEEMVE